ncbi:MAG: protein jag [Clostridia bacterium]|nr:protein jag [Clostridia bacterium]
MDYIEVSGKNVDEALTNALIQLETTSDKVEYEVIEKGSSGFLGMFNKPAVIRVRKKEEEVEETVETVKKPSKKYSDSKNNNYKDGKKKFKSDDKKDVKPAAKAEVKPEVKPEVKSADVKPVDVKSESDNNVETKTESSKYTTVMPNEEIERRITTFLTDMFKAMGFEVAIKVSFDDPECVYVDLSGPNMGVLIGKRGQTLDSIQYLTSLVVNKGKDKYVRIKLDTEDYRNRRKETLESLARNIAYKVKRTRRPVSLEPMNPYERRIIHSALQNDKFVSTKSEGEEPFRHVVVFLDREKNPR